VTHLAESIAAVFIASLAAYVALEYLKTFKRRNDLLDRFQAYERTNEVRLLRADQTAERFENLLGNHERLVGRVTQLEDHTKSEISKLGGEILGQVQEMKTQQSAAFQQSSRFTPTGRNLKP
jgi:hypothetical protein